MHYSNNNKLNNYPNNSDKNATNRCTKDQLTVWLWLLTFDSYLSRITSVWRRVTAATDTSPTSASTSGTSRQAPAVPSCLSTNTAGCYSWPCLRTPRCWPCCSSTPLPAAMLSSSTSTFVRLPFGEDSRPSTTTRTPPYDVWQHTRAALCSSSHPTGTSWLLRRLATSVDRVMSDCGISPAETQLFTSRSVILLRFDD